MNAYIYPIKTAALIFPFLALVLALPFMIREYRRYGSFVFWRAFVVYSFVFYLLTAYFLIMLPLPPREEVAALTTPRMNLVPFKFVTDFLRETVFSPGNPDTWLPALKQMVVLQPAFNILLTVPFGVYLRYYFKQSLPKVLLMSFGLSLFFELTQLSGLYGIYPRPYRLFDVDDLLMNSFGGFVGGLIAPALMHAFPTRDEIDAHSYQVGRHVSLTRRIVAFVIDNLFVVSIVGFALGLLATWLGAKSWRNAPVLTLYIPLALMQILWPMLNNGQTIGKEVVKIRIANADGGPARWWQIGFRQFAFYGIGNFSFQGFMYFFTQIFSSFHRTLDNYILLGVFSLGFMYVVANIGWGIITRSSHFFHDEWAHTMQVSTVEPIDDKNGETLANK